MLRGIENSISAITAYGTAMEQLAERGAQFQVDGYKESRGVFINMFTTSLTKLGGSHGVRAGAANTSDIAGGVNYIPLGLNFSQGGLKEAGPLNAAVVGKGLFVLQPETSQEFLYTRASDFVFAADGSLVDAFGRRVMGYRMKDGKADKTALVPIQLDPETTDLADIGFETDGILTTNYEARASAQRDIANGDSTVEVPDGEQSFQLALANIPNPSALRSASGTAFRTSINSGEPREFGVSGEGAVGTVSGGFSESSNVDPAETTIIGIQLQRGYNMAQAMLTLLNGTLKSLMSVVEKA